LILFEVVAKLSEPQRLRFAEITEQLASLYTEFSQNVLHDESNFSMVLRSDDELKGLPDFVLASARQAAIEREVPGDDAHVHHACQIFCYAFYDF